MTMRKPLKFSAVLMLFAGILTGASAGCSRWGDSAHLTAQTAASAEAKPTPPAGAASSPANSTVHAAKVDPYQQAVARASTAYSFSRSAQSGDDWKLVVSRWQQAIYLMTSVPKSNPRYLQVSGKLTEYRRNLAYAQRQANRSVGSTNSGGVVVVRPQAVTRPPTSTNARPTAPVAIAPSPAVAPVPPAVDRVFSAPIVRRAGNTPVIRVTFNGNQNFDMVVDTGASGTLITQQMAAALGVVPVAETSVDTASARDVSFPLGYVQSIEVGGAVAQNVLVAVAGPELGLGLLGHDFFGNYDVTIRQDKVEFRERG